MLKSTCTLLTPLVAFVSSESFYVAVQKERGDPFKSRSNHKITSPDHHVARCLSFLMLLLIPPFFYVGHKTVKKQTKYNHDSI